jgi:hypothetical protein
VRRAPSRSPAHQRFRPLGPQARTPGSAGVSVAESRIAVASRSSTAPVIAAQSAAGSDEEFRGDHANPQWSALCPAAALKERGAASVSAYVSHGALSGAACQRVDTSVLTELVITDTIESSDTVKACAKVRQVTVAPLIGEAIRRIANEESVSKLFD